MFDKQKSTKQSQPETQEPKVSPKAHAKAAAPSADPSKVAMIGPGISIVGDVKADTSLKVEGQIEGRGIQCAEEVEIAEPGQVTASIVARVVKVSGTVTGDISGSDKVVISRSGRVQGNIVAPRVQLEDGALFRGSIDMTPAEPGGQQKPAAKAASKPEKSAPVASAQAKAPAQERKEPGLNLKSG